MKRISYVAIAVILVLVATAFAGAVTLNQKDLAGPNGLIWKAIGDLQTQVNDLKTQVANIPAGEQGPQGEQGPPGEQGETGPAGADGATVHFGETQTLYEDYLNEGDWAAYDGVASSDGIITIFGEYNGVGYGQEPVNIIISDGETGAAIAASSGDAEHLNVAYLSVPLQEGETYSITGIHASRIVVKWFPLVPT